MMQVYTFGLLASLFFGGGYQVASWANQATLYQAQQDSDKALEELSIDAGHIIQASLKESNTIQIQWRTKYEKVYIRDTAECLDADGVWDWNDANESANKTILTLDSLPETRANSSR